VIGKFKEGFIGRIFKLRESEDKVFSLTSPACAGITTTEKNLYFAGKSYEEKQDIFSIVRRYNALHARVAAGG
jgi:hypothetical protein